MGLFDELIKNTLGGNSQQSGEGRSPLGGKVGALAVMAILQWVQSQGGFQAVLAKLQQGGLGDLAGSWLGKGDNHPVDANQLQSAFSNTDLQSLADHLGTSQDDALAKLKEFLPQFIDRASPQGQLEPGVENHVSNGGTEDLAKMVDGLFGKK